MSDKVQLNVIEGIEIVHNPLSNDRYLVLDRDIARRVKDTLDRIFSDEKVKKVKKLIEAAKKLLVDDVIEVHQGLYQCVHCGAHAVREELIRHHDNCSAEELRKAIEECE